MDETDLNHLLKEMREPPRGGVGDRFSHEVLLQLANRKVMLPVGLLSAVTAVTILFSASIGYSLAWAHEHKTDPAVPPSWTGIAGGELLASR